MTQTINSAAELREALERIRLAKLSEELESQPITEEDEEESTVRKVVARYVANANI